METDQNHLSVFHRKGSDIREYITQIHNQVKVNCWENETTGNNFLLFQVDEFKLDFHVLSIEYVTRWRGRQRGNGNWDIFLSFDAHFLVDEIEDEIRYFCLVESVTHSDEDISKIMIF